MEDLNGHFDLHCSGEVRMARPLNPREVWLSKISYCMDKTVVVGEVGTLLSINEVFRTGSTRIKITG